MSRRIIMLSLVVLLVAGVAVAGDMAWFDMEGCAMCKNMGSKEGLMDNITWEQHSISNGIVSITMVKPKFMDAYRAAHADMKKTGEKLMSGEQLQMCGSCMALGSCMMKGVKQEYVETSNGDVWIVTSDNPEVVTELQGWAKRNKEEMKKMKATKG